MWAINTVLTTRVYMNLISRVRQPMVTPVPSTNAYIDFATAGNSSMGSTVPNGTESTEMRPVIALPIKNYDIPGKTPVRTAPAPRRVSMPAVSHNSPRRDIAEDTRRVERKAVSHSLEEGRLQSLELPVDSWQRASWKLDVPLPNRTRTPSPAVAGKRADGATDTL